MRSSCEVKYGDCEAKYGDAVDCRSLDTDASHLYLPVTLVPA
ncbi:MAG: hypothetical protein ACYSWQ_04835 [Planctomycetota bacterium]